MVSNSQAFIKAVALYNVMAETPIKGEGKNLRAALCLGNGVSLLDVLSVFLVLYRLPLVFPGEIQLSFKEQVLGWLRPHLGTLARMRDYLVRNPQRAGNERCRWPSGSRPAVLFISFSRVFYRDVLLPVAERLRFLQQCDVVNLDGSYEASRQDVHSLRPHIDANVLSRQKEMLKSLAELRSRLLVPDQLRAFVDNDVCAGGDWRLLGNELRWLFNREFPRLVPVLAVAEHIISQHRPDLIITADDADQRSRAFSLTGKHHRVPTLVIQQGLFRNDYPEGQFFSATKIACMGEQSRSVLLDQGVLPDEIVITGPPGFDRLIDDHEDHSMAVRKNLGIREGVKMVLFASQPYYVGLYRSKKIRRDMIRAAFSAIQTLPNAHLVVKPHPSDRVSELESLCGKRRKVSFCDKNEDISILIKACDVFMGMASTTVLQALYIGRPVITIDFPESGVVSPYFESGATWVARSSEEIITYLELLTSEGNSAERSAKELARGRFVKEMAYLPDGRSTQRVVNLISKILAERGGL